MPERLMERGHATGLRDLFGKMICFGDRLRFRGNGGEVWSSIVIFEDGMFTVSYLSKDVICEQNPRGWDREHDWTSCRMWSTKVGYPEYGTANSPRRPLTQIADYWLDGEWEDFYQRYGYSGGRIIKAEIVDENEMKGEANG